MEKVTHCQYRFCGKELPVSNTSGRKKNYCDKKCKGMEQYYRDKDNGVDRNKKKS